VRGGHRLNHAVLVALMSDPSAYEVVEAREPRRVRGHADVSVVAPAYGPDVS
jgi:UDP-3-O-[3-hydroxymyristoyl] N-acetylglucosamine deacetylase